MNTYPCAMLAKAKSCGAPEDVPCGEPSTRFFSLWKDGRTIFAPMCKEHEKFHDPTKFIHDTEINEAEYLVWRIHEV